MTRQHTMESTADTLWTSSHPGARAVRTFLRIAAIAALLVGISVLLDAIAPNSPSKTWTNSVLIPMTIGLITGIVALVSLAMSWSDIIAYLKTRGTARHVFSVLLILAGVGILFVLVPVLALDSSDTRTWQQRRGFGVIVVIGIALIVSGIKLLRR